MIAPQPRQTTGGVLGGRGRAARDEDGRAVLDQLLRNPAPDAVGAARDDCDSVGQERVGGHHRHTVPTFTARVLEEWNVAWRRVRSVDADEPSGR